MYDYQTEKNRIKADDDAMRQVILLFERLPSGDLLTIQDMFRLTGVFVSSNWQQIAMAEYLLELGLLRERTTPNVMTQNRVFMKP